MVFPMNNYGRDSQVGTRIFSIRCAKRLEQSAAVVLKTRSI